jgi:heat shock protein HslJ
MRRIRVGLLAVLACAGCGPPDALETADFVGMLWQLTLFQDGTSNPVPVLDGSRYTVTFGSDGRASVRSDCNTCDGPYSLDGAVFRVGPLACTRVGCPAGSLDPAYPAALEKARAVSQELETQLTIHGDGVTLVFRK